MQSVVFESSNAHQMLIDYGTALTVKADLGALTVTAEVSTWAAVLDLTAMRLAVLMPSDPSLNVPMLDNMQSLLTELARGVAGNKQRLTNGGNEHLDSGNDSPHNVAGNG